MEYTVYIVRKSGMDRYVVEGLKNARSYAVMKLLRLKSRGYASIFTGDYRYSDPTPKSPMETIHPYGEYTIPNTNWKYYQVLTVWSTDPHKIKGLVTWDGKLFQETSVSPKIRAYQKHIGNFKW